MAYRLIRHRLVERFLSKNCSRFLVRQKWQ